MSSSENPTPGVTATAHAESPVAADPRRGPPRDDTAPLSADVYGRVAHACLPTWVRHACPSRGIGLAIRSPRVTPERPAAVYRRQSAALAIAALLEADANIADDHLLRECVRVSLIRWQLTLSTTGAPAHTRARRSAWTAASFARVARLLTMSPSFQTRGLLDDVGRHARWFTANGAYTPWVEASLATALTDTAVLVRDPKWLDTAKLRMAALLARQDDEGWFPERGGADIGFLSLTVDAIAKTWATHGWEHLWDPLERAVRFLTHFVHPDGNIGGVYGSRGSAFISPHGVELLARRSPEAASLARLCRHRCAHFEHDRQTGWDNAAYTHVGVAHALAHAEDTSYLTPSRALPWRTAGRTYLPNAGLLVVSTPHYQAVVNVKRGGALHVTWRAGPSLEDPGLTVVTPNCVRVRKKLDRSATATLGTSSLTVRGKLARVVTKNERMGWIKWAFGRLARLRYPRRHAGNDDGQLDRDDPLRVGVNQYYRRVDFEPDAVHLSDIIRCRTPIQFAICAAPATAWPKAVIDRTPRVLPDRGTIIAEGGRCVRLNRTYHRGRLTAHLE